MVCGQRADQASLDFVVLADDIAEKLPRGRSYLKDQLRGHFDPLQHR